MTFHSHRKQGDERSLDLPGRVAAQARMAWETVLREYRIRRTVRELQALDARALRDIGLDRDDIESAVRARAVGRWTRG